MDQSEWLAVRFEEHRPHLRAVAYRMLGSLGDADDAVQDAWERVSRADADVVEDLKAWLTTIVARVCLNLLRSRTARRERPIPDPIVSPEAGSDPEAEAVLADSVGFALQIVIGTLAPAERLAFVLHDIFDLPFDEIAAIVGRTPQATRQLASRARRRVKEAELPAQERDLARQRKFVDAFFAAGRAGDFDALVSVLHPDVVARVDLGTGGSKMARGAAAVARHARQGAGVDAELHHVLINGAAGVVVTRAGLPIAVISFTVAADRIIEIDTIADPERVAELAAPAIARYQILGG
jgi:RNA polymerase sigma-70 factor (ECF subfamily)